MIGDRSRPIARNKNVRLFFAPSFQGGLSENIPMVGVGKIARGVMVYESKDQKKVNLKQEWLCLPDTVDPRPRFKE